MTSEMSPNGPAALAFGVLDMIFMNLSMSIFSLWCVKLRCLFESCLFCMMCLDGYRPSSILTMSGVLMATGVSCVNLLIALLYWSLFAANCALCKVEDSLMLSNLFFFS